MSEAQARLSLPAVGGYVLSGGQSSRMGTNKALLELGGRRLIEHAVMKLERLCAGVKILSADAALAQYGSLVKDRWQGCGPLAGIEAALDDSPYPWNVILPVDVPFVGTRLLDDWMRSALHGDSRELRVSMLAAGKRVHPTLLIVHRDVGAYLRDCLRAGRYRVLRALEEAAAAIALERKVGVERVFWQAQHDEVSCLKAPHGDEPWKQAPVGGRCFDLFANLNTPEEFAAAEMHAEMLDT